jgi:hypothetical protein
MPSRKKKKPDQESSDQRLPQTPADTNERSNQPYQGYDEEKTNNDHQRDYDIDENNINERSDEYKDWNRDDRPE